MSKHLIKVEETYRADTEKEAVEIIEKAKHSEYFTLAKYSSVERETKQKGEVVDSWRRVTLTKIVDDEKEPVSDVTLDYSHIQESERASNDFELV